ncbi:MAG: methionine--tRNA ligase subunit beta [Candidatus Pacebacteria bacterium]|nr:methionine--tRNA ligase subunit beta [Candidatus Paceibacterota bacterium]MBP9818436.1 methionine--tRNA ligase subunit beta [Candidatus Paceibacterota bacterium]
MNNTDTTITNVEDTTDSAVPVTNPAINFDDFLKVKMAVGKVVSAEKLEKSPKLLRLSVDFGETEEFTDEAGEVSKILKPRQVLSGIAKTFQPEELVGKSFAFVVNLEPRQIMGMESQAMILAASDEQGLVLFSPTREIQAGSTLG